ncbi:MAG: aromatic ring-hydroxylating dioxygenase subunit alpha [Ilumatobacteraceae bacterium]
MTDVDNPTVAAPTRFPIEITRRIVERIRQGSLDTAAHAMSEPASVFTDPVQFERERTAFFRRGAHVVGWEGEVAEPNSFTTKDVAGLPVLITRDGDGELHAFRNVCTHRGARVADGCGVARRLTCPYHAWTFDTAGNLAGQPDSWAFDGIERATLGLMPLPLASVHGLLVVGLADDVDPAAELASIAPQLSGYSYATHQVICHHNWTLQANWKIAFDVNLEGYHIAALHRATLANLVVNHAIHDTFGRHARWGFPTRAAMSMVDMPEASWPEPAPLTVVHTFFPSCVVLETPVSSQMFRIYPGRHVGESRVELTEASIRPVQSDDERAARMQGAEFAELVVGQEDFPVAEQCQRGAESGLSRFVFGTVEPMLQHWHTTWREALEASN